MIHGDKGSKPQKRSFWRLYRVCLSLSALGDSTHSGEYPAVGRGHRTGAMQDPASELRRIPLPRTPGNRDKKNTGPPRRGETGEPGLVGNSNIYTNPTYTANR